MTSTQLTDGATVPEADLTGVNYTTLYVGHTGSGLLEFGSK